MQGYQFTPAIAFASLAHSFSHMFVLLYATAVLVLEAEWGLGYDQLIALSIPGSVMFGLAAVPAGWLGDRWSATGMMAVFFFGTGLASIATGFATGPWGIAIGLTLIGSFAAIYHPVGVPWLIRQSASPGRALGVNGVFGSLGTAAAAVVAGVLIDLWGWRAAFIGPGVIATLSGVAFLWFHWRRQPAERAVAVGAATAGSRDPDMRRVYTVLAVCVVCTGLIYQILSVALPKIFEERLGYVFGDGIAGLAMLVSICFLVAGMTQLIGGELADRYRLKTVYVVSQAGQIPFLVLAFLIYNPVLVPVVALIISFSVMGQPAENTLISKYTPARWQGRVFGAKFLLTLGVSSLGLGLVPLFYAISGNLSMLFLALAGFAALATLTALGLPAPRQTSRGAGRRHRLSASR